MSQIRFVVASTALLAAGWLASGPPHAANQAVDRAPTVTVRSAIAVTIEPAPSRLELPRWFGDITQAARIAGKLYGAKAGTKVRLAIDVPDPSIWVGREVAIDAEGRFDFGMMRAGAYLLLAFDAEPRSAITPVDTTRDSGDAVKMYALPCTESHGAFFTTSDRNTVDSAPAAYAPILLSGWTLGITSATGNYNICMPAGSDDAQLRVPGFADPPAGYRVDSERHRLLWPEYLESGFVLGADGAPAAHVGVQPIWHTGDMFSPCRASLTVVTTDETGQFAFNGGNQVCGFRVLSGSAAHDARYELGKYGEPQIVRLPAGGLGLHLFE